VVTVRHYPQKESLEKVPLIVQMLLNRMKRTKWWRRTSGCEWSATTCYILLFLSQYLQTGMLVLVLVLSLWL